jgi:hypothetical protein
MGTQRNRTFSYALLDSTFSETNCTVASIDLPNIQRTNVTNISQAQDPGPLNYHTTERSEIVTFTVTYIPYDTTDGKKLLTSVKSLVAKVLEKDYKSAVAIIQLKRNSTTVEHETKINDCIIIQGDVVIDGDTNTVNIIFTFQGLLDSEY